MGQALLTKQEIADLMGMSAKWVDRNLDRTAARQIGTAANGKPVVAYELAALPADAQIKWAEQQRQKVVELQPAGTPGQMALALAVPDGPNLSDADRAEAEKRFRVIEPLVRPDQFEAVWIQCRRRKCELIAWLAQQHGTRPRTIYHWLEAWKKDGLPGLVSKDRSDKGKPKALNAAALDFLVAASLPRKGAYGELSVKEIYRAYQEEAAWRARHTGKVLGDFERAKYARYVGNGGRLLESALLPAVSYECLRQWINRVPEVVRVMARDGVEAFANTQEIISYRQISAVQPLDYVVMDHRRLDMFCLVPERGGWKLQRPWLTAAIDMRTRKWLGWVIVATPSSDSIAAVLKKVFVEHGVPRACYWDNGKDFTCEWLEGRQTRSRRENAIAELQPSMRGVLETLGVRVHHAIVKRARAKLIEPNFKNTALYDRTLPWWCGHKPSARPERFDALIEQHEQWVRKARPDPAFPTIEDVAAMYDDCLHALNEREHTGEGMAKVTPDGRGWMCPNEAWERLIGQVERRTIPAEVLQFCFAKRRELTVRHGELKATFGAREYHYRLIGNEVALMALNGRTVELAYDPLDLGTGAVYCDGRFVGIVSCVPLRRMGEADFIADERARRMARRQVRLAIEAAHRTVHVPDQLERAARRQAVERPDVARVEIPVALPAPVTEAAAAAQADKEFDFEGAPEGRVAVLPAAQEPEQDDDSEFRFF